MGEPRTKEKPTLQDVAVELTSAMSALNMPDPERCPPEMVKHAYEHLEAAMEMLVAAMPVYQQALETAAGERPSVFEGWLKGRR